MDVSEKKRGVFMKKAGAIILAAIILGLSAFILIPQKTENAEYLRIHIRANSNAQVDQRVKYAVKESVVDFLTPTVAEVTSKERLIGVLRENLSEIEKTAKAVLEENGFSYGARAEVKNEKFPTRDYGKVTLKEGFYDALIIYLGEGTGDNWWCVLYPPLCFTGTGRNYIYKSKLQQIIRAFFEAKA